MAASIGVPSVKGMSSAFGDFAIGAGGGLVFALSQAVFGSGIIGALAAPVLAGSVIKGNRGTVISTIAGYMLGSGLLTPTSAAAAPAGRGYM